MKLVKTLHSVLDKSVNFIFEGDFPGFFEARYVRRCSDYFVCYLSSQSGCNQGCQQCHLTATKQTQFVNACSEIYLEQAKAVFEYYNKQSGPKAKKVHFSFMARGEPLDNQHLMDGGRQAVGWAQDTFKELKQRQRTDFFDEPVRLEDKTTVNFDTPLTARAIVFKELAINKVVNGLSELAFENEVFPRFCVSTIMPKSIKDLDLAWVFRSQPVDLYYSIYSIDEEWKNKWMPQAMPVDDALDMLVDYQDKTRKIIKIHWPMIKDENDSIENTLDICKKIKDRNLRVDINIVRYNPFDPSLGEESPEKVVAHREMVIREELPYSKVKVVGRVGYDVNASCGMFV